MQQLLRRRRLCPSLTGFHSRWKKTVRAATLLGGSGLFETTAPHRRLSRWGPAPRSDRVQCQIGLHAPRWRRLWNDALTSTLQRIQVDIKDLGVEPGLAVGQVILPESPKR